MCVSVTMPVTLDAAENDPIFSGRSAYAVELLREDGQVDVAVRVLGDGHDVADRLAPRQLVGVVLERADEHDRALVGRDVRRQVVAVVEVGGDAQVEDADQLVDRRRRARAAEDDDVSSSPPTASRMMRRASSRSRVVCSPVPLDSVWVLA